MRHGRALKCARCSRPGLRPVVETCGNEACGAHCCARHIMWTDQGWRCSKCVRATKKAAKAAERGTVTAR